jgi:hypothetical protein
MKQSRIDQMICETLVAPPDRERSTCQSPGTSRALVPASLLNSDFTSLAEAMPEEKWSFKTQGAFADVRSFAEQVKHMACANEAWAKKLRGEKPPDRCDTGGPIPARMKTEILPYLRESFVMLDGEIARRQPT